MRSPPGWDLWPYLLWRTGAPELAYPLRASRVKGCEPREAGVPPEAISLERKEVAMSRRERVASTPVRPVHGLDGRPLTRGVIGIALIFTGVLVGGIAG